jgi:AcrR family transcriptional regulator
VRYHRADVVDQALRVLDAHGLPDLTMRRLGAELGVQPSALYHHFANKQSLLAAVADEVLARADWPTGGPWESRATEVCSVLRDALLAYRDGAEVVSSTFALGLGATEPLDRLTAAIAAGGFDDGTARRAATALLHFVLGHVSHEQQRLQYDSLGVLADDAAAEPDPAGAFAFGIDLLVGGLTEVSRSRT